MEMLLYVHYAYEMFEVTKREIRSRKSKNDRQHNDQANKDKRTNNHLQTIIHKLTDRATPLIPRMNLAE